MIGKDLNQNLPFKKLSLLYAPKGPQAFESLVGEKGEGMERIYFFLSIFVILICSPPPPNIFCASGSEVSFKKIGIDQNEALPYVRD